jgi:DNA replication regulator DPB11
MKVVSLEWFEQSLERGMVLDEECYHPTLPIEDRGRDAWDRRAFSPPASNKRPRDAEPSQALNPFRRKLRRSASTRMGSQSEALWAGITAASLERQHEDADDWTEGNLDKQDTPREHTPARPHSSPNSDENPPPVDPAYVPQPPVLSLSSNGNAALGVFEGRVVFPHGFDDEKVIIPGAHPCLR